MRDLQCRRVQESLLKGAEFELPSGLAPHAQITEPQGSFVGDPEPPVWLAMFIFLRGECVASSRFTHTDT